jgi:hypothetical protein
MYDLQLRAKEKDSKALLKRCIELGWDCVAWTTAVTGKATGNHVKPQPSVTLEPALLRDAAGLRALALPLSSTAPSSSSSSSSSASAPPPPTPGLRQLTRLTVTVDDVGDAQSLQTSNPLLGQFDLVVARPGNAKVFAHLCKHADVDMITLDFTHRLPFSLNKKLLDEATKRGVHFEVRGRGHLTRFTPPGPSLSCVVASPPPTRQITYSPLLCGAAGARKEVFANTKVSMKMPVTAPCLQHTSIHASITLPRHRCCCSTSAGATSSSAAAPRAGRRRGARTRRAPSAGPSASTGNR